MGFWICSVFRAGFIINKDEAIVLLYLNTYRILQIALKII